VLLAVPVAPPGSIAKLATAADEVVCLASPEPFFAVGQWYWDFEQTSDDEVVDLLGKAARPAGASLSGRSTDTEGPDRDEDVELTAGPVHLAGHLMVPPAPLGLVLFAHGSGSSRQSPRNQYVAAALNEAGLGTLLFDLLTADEALDRSNVFDIGLLADRLSAVTRWLRAQPEADGVLIGYFGASTGAAAALRAAALPDAEVAAIVSRGGRPDLAGPGLSEVRAATLLIVGGQDDVVLDLNRQALACLNCESHLAVVPGATHLFEERGALEAVAGLARDWFTNYLAPARQSVT
jgi:putative phosphoribosyl transferase